ncbi:MAG: tail fiber domain-containing protein [Verrucomicrobiota bacterium]
MKTTKYLCLSIWTATILLASLVQAAAQSTAFTYQGRLFVGDLPANGLYDLQFTNYDAATTGTALGGFNTNALPVTNGLFTVTLDFGAVFDGTARWLEISERTNGTGAFATLAPRQLLAAAPYATYAASAGAVPGLTIVQNAGGAPNVIEGSTANSVESGVMGATIGGGDNNTIQANADLATIGGGFANLIQTGASEATIGGGDGHHISASEATIGGGRGHSIGPNAHHATIGGGEGNGILDNAHHATIGGGQNNGIQTNSTYATIGGGGGSRGNRIGHYANNATIGGGYNNRILDNADSATIGGGANNTIQNISPGSIIAGGADNQIQSGSTNATIGGGDGNTIQFNANYATIPGGLNNIATNFAFAAGTGAQAVNQGAFVWADSSGPIFSSTANNQFAVRATGGAAFQLGNATALVQTTGGVLLQLGSANAIVQADDTSSDPDAKQLVIQGNANSSRQLELGYKTAGSANYGTIQAVEQGVAYRSLVLQPSGGGVGIGTTTPGNLLVVGNSPFPPYCNGAMWVNGSDRNSKEAFTAINPRAVLEKVSALPITQWRYKAEADGTEHIGPMAQDFHAAFGLNGNDDKHISTVDEGGVALAAIQGLNQKLEETRTENADLRARLEKLERLLQPSK